MVAHTAGTHGPGSRISASQCVWEPQDTHHIQQAAEVWLSDWQGEADQGSLLNYRLRLCTQLHLNAVGHWSPSCCRSGRPTTAHQRTSMGPSLLFAQLFLQRCGQPSLPHSISKPAWQALTNSQLKFTGFTHFCTMEFPLKRGKSVALNLVPSLLQWLLSLSPCF